MLLFNMMLNASVIITASNQLFLSAESQYYCTCY